MTAWTAAQDTEVASTIGALERKLQSLEDELRGVSGGLGGAERGGLGDRIAPEPPRATAGAPEPSAAAAAVPEQIDRRAPAAFDPAALVPGPAPRPPVAPAAPSRTAAGGAGAEELERLRAQLDRSARALMAECERVLAGLDAPPEPASWSGSALGGLVSGLPPAPDLRGASPASAAPAPGDHVMEGAVTVEAGPFADIAMLSLFERALTGVSGVRDVYVRGFDGANAYIDVALGGPVALGAELQRSAAVAFTVAQADATHLRLVITTPG